jgi:two-component system, cell cycle sensor histidine kinase and response regulator CckA
VTERESVHESLRASEELLRAFFEQSAVGFAHIDAASGRLLRVNEKLCEMSGRTRDELLRISWQELIHPDELRSSSESVGRLLSGAEKTVTNEVRFIRGDGAIRWIRAAASCMNLPDGALSLIVIAEDVTEKRRTEDALREAENRLATVFRVAPVPIAIIRWGDRRYIDINEAFTAAFGWTKNEVVGKTPAQLGIQAPEEDIVPGADAPSLSERLSSLGSLTSAEIVLRSKAGLELICLASVAFADIGGERCVVGFLRDVTRARALDESLRRSAAELRAMFDVAPVGIAQTDPATGRFIHVNPRMCAITGYSAEELYAMDAHELTNPEDVNRHDQLYGAVARGERDGYRLEKRYVCKGGRVTWVDVNLTVLHDASGRKSLIAAVEDISERRAAARELDLQMTAFQAADNAIVITDRDGVVLRVNRSVSKLTGYEESEVVGRMLGIMRPDKHSPETFRALWGAIRAGRVWRGEIANRRKDGSPYHEDVTITPVRNERGEIANFIAIKIDVTERNRAAEAVAEAKEQQRIALDAAGLGTWRHEIAQGRMLLDERAMVHLGFDRSEASAAEVFARIHPDDLQTVRQGVAKVHDPRGDGKYAGETRVVLSSGEVRWLSINVQGRSEGGGGERRVVSTIVTSRDVTDTKRAEQRQRDTEDQLRAAQKMEAVGRLAGGVAHDFNNLLSVILSYSEAASMGLATDDPLRADLGEIVRAAERAEGLTAQLMAFSRHQVWRPQSLDIQALVQGIAKMMRRLIGEDIELQISAEGDLYRTRADPGQIEQVLMNLAVNARDAMPDGGRLAIAIANVEIDASRAPALQVDPGSYIQLSVSDTGCGMDPVTLARAFDPFFTTKGVGKGTGLGLSTVYGIVRQSGGSVVAESALGAGATFRIYLKRDDGAQERAPGSVPALRAAPGGETVLVVEDEEALRKVVCRVLTGAGYKVLVAADAAEALLLGEQRGSEVSLVLTDVIMPGMNGRQLVQRLFPRCPAAKVMFMSGYADDAIERLDVLGHDFLRKPFNGETLVRKVRAVLDGRATAE